MSHYDSLYEAVQESEINDKLEKNSNSIVILLNKRSIYQNDCRKVSSLTKDLILNEITAINNKISRINVENIRLAHLKELVNKRKITQIQVSNYIQKGYF